MNILRTSGIMPRRLVRANLAEADFGMQTVIDVADTYEASLQASAHRIVDLWPEDVMFLVAEVQNKPSERDDPDAPAKLRVSYAWSRGAWVHSAIQVDRPGRPA
jgi:hypothetical protein